MIVIHRVTKDGKKYTRDCDDSKARFRDMAHAKEHGDELVNLYGGSYTIGEEAPESKTSQIVLHHEKDGHEMLYRHDINNVLFRDLKHAQEDGVETCKIQGGTFFVTVEPVTAAPTTTTTTTTVWGKGCKHTAIEPVMIGGFPVHLGAGDHIDGEKVLDVVDYVVTLNGYLPGKTFFGQCLQVIDATLVDRGGVPDGWGKFIENMAGIIRDGKKIVAFCIGSHGRTGCFGASLIAVMEPEVDDPIAAIRQRHCHHAVESKEQAEAIFALKGKQLPEVYEKEFGKKWTSFSHGSHDSGKKKTETGSQAVAMIGSAGTADLTFGDWWEKMKGVLVQQWAGYFPNLTDEARETRIRAIYRETYHTTDATDEVFDKVVASAMADTGITDIDDEEEPLPSGWDSCDFCGEGEPITQLISLGNNVVCCIDCYDDGEDEDEEAAVISVEEGNRRLQEWREQTRASSAAMTSAIDAGEDIDG
jgi:hypothetical protein